MNAKQLKNILNQYSDEEAEKLTVVIEIRDDTVGPTPAVGVEGVFAGFDWDINRLMITPETPLMHYAERIGTDVPRQKFIRKMNGDTICRCPLCYTDIDENDKFCKQCGQKLK